ncbi:tyrosine--tRNA ligase [Archaeoglobales archaeon]|nr:MAG: tyrosine--tRNA ligase [Archaeoglobales archaeon]
MDAETKVEVVKSFATEIITEEELLNLFETNEHPIAYDGFEPSGLAHLSMVYRAITLERILRTGVRFKLLIADSFAWINNKLGGNIERIRKVGEYFIEVWKALGVDTDKVEIVWHKDIFDDSEYWKKVMLIAKMTTVKRATRALIVAGREEGKNNPVAFLFYPVMQCADVFQLEVDICQLGIDQRKVNMLAREVAPRLGFKKPIAVHHPLILGLNGGKMSKSVPDSAVFVHDSREEIFRKMRKAYCPKSIENNPVIDIAEKITFLKFGNLTINNREFESVEELKEAYLKGEIHPIDLKNSVAESLDRIIEPVRKHFEKNKKARELYEIVRGFEITR